MRTFYFVLFLAQRSDGQRLLYGHALFSQNGNVYGKCIARLTLFRNGIRCERGGGQFWSVCGVTIACVSERVCTMRLADWDGRTWETLGLPLIQWRALNGKTGQKCGVSENPNSTCCPGCARWTPKSYICPHCSFDYLKTGSGSPSKRVLKSWERLLLFVSAPLRVAMPRQQVSDPPGSEVESHNRWT